VFWNENYQHASSQDGNNSVNVPFAVFVFVIPGNHLLPKFEVKVAQQSKHSNYRLCETVRARRNYKNIEILCRRNFTARSVKIMTLMPGRLSMCEVAIYDGNRG